MGTERRITIVLWIVEALLTGVHGMELKCTLSSDINGTVFHLYPPPDADCESMWYTPQGELHGTQYHMAPHKVSMKECLNILTYRGDCLKDGVLSSHNADCSGKCRSAYKQPTYNGGVVPSACLPVLLACILAIGLLHLAYRTGHDASAKVERLT